MSSNPVKPAVVFTPPEAASLENAYTSIGLLERAELIGKIQVTRALDHTVATAMLDGRDISKLSRLNSDDMFFFAATGRIYEQCDEETPDFAALKIVRDIARECRACVKDKREKTHVLETLLADLQKEAPHLVKPVLRELHYNSRIGLVKQGNVYVHDELPNDMLNPYLLTFLESVVDPYADATDGEFYTQATEQKNKLIYTILKDAAALMGGSELSEADAKSLRENLDRLYAIDSEKVIDLLESLRDSAEAYPNPNEKLLSFVEQYPTTWWARRPTWQKVGLCAFFGAGTLLASYGYHSAYRARLQSSTEQSSAEPTLFGPENCETAVCRPVSLDGFEIPAPVLPRPAAAGSSSASSNPVLNHEMTPANTSRPLVNELCTAQSTPNFIPESNPAPVPPRPAAAGSSSASSNPVLNHEMTPANATRPQEQCSVQFQSKDPFANPVNNPAKSSTDAPPLPHFDLSQLELCLQDNGSGLNSTGNSTTNGTSLGAPFSFGESQRSRTQPMADPSTPPSGEPPTPPSGSSTSSWSTESIVDAMRWVAGGLVLLGGLGTLFYSSSRSRQRNDEVLDSDGNQQVIDSNSAAAKAAKAAEVARQVAIDAFREGDSSDSDDEKEVNSDQPLNGQDFASASSSALAAPNGGDSAGNPPPSVGSQGGSGAFSSSSSAFAALNGGASADGSVNSPEDVRNLFSQHWEEQQRSKAASTGQSQSDDPIVVKDGVKERTKQFFSEHFRQPKRNDSTSSSVAVSVSRSKDVVSGQPKEDGSVKLADLLADYHGYVQKNTGEEISEENLRKLLAVKFSGQLKNRTKKSSLTTDDRKAVIRVIEDNYHKPKSQASSPLVASSPAAQASSPSLFGDDDEDDYAGGTRPAANSSLAGSFFSGPFGGNFGDDAAPSSPRSQASGSSIAAAAPSAAPAAAGLFASFSDTVSSLFGSSSSSSSSASASASSAAVEIEGAEEEDAEEVDDDGASIDGQKSGNGSDQPTLETALVPFSPPVIPSSPLSASSSSSPSPIVSARMDPAAAAWVRQSSNKQHADAGWMSKVLTAVNPFAPRASADQGDSSSDQVASSSPSPASSPAPAAHSSSSHHVDLRLASSGASVVNVSHGKRPFTTATSSASLREDSPQSSPSLTSSPASASVAAPAAVSRSSAQFDLDAALNNAVLGIGSSSQFATLPAFSGSTSASSPEAAPAPQSSSVLKRFGPEAYGFDADKDYDAAPAAASSSAHARSPAASSSAHARRSLIPTLNGRWSSAADAPLSPLSVSDDGKEELSDGDEPLTASQIMASSMTTHHDKEAHHEDDNFGFTEYYMPSEGETTSEITRYVAAQKDQIVDAHFLSGVAIEDLHEEARNEGLILYTRQPTSGGKPLTIVKKDDIKKAKLLVANIKIRNKA